MMIQIYKMSFFGLLILCCLLFTHSALAVSNKYTVAVMSHDDFVPDRTGTLERQVLGLPDELAGRIIEKMTQTRRFNMIERKALRRIVTGQRFGAKAKKTYLDKTLDKTLTKTLKKTEYSEKVSLESNRYWSSSQVRAEHKVTLKKQYGYGGEVNQTTAAWANYNDNLKDYQDVGSVLKADYLLMGNLEKTQRSVEKVKLAYNRSGQSTDKKMVDARLRLRIINVSTGSIVGATSIRTRLSETLFTGVTSTQDYFSIYDKLAGLVSIKVLDILYPAEIVNLDPVMISRGSNDGVNEGDEYIVYRQGKIIKDSSGIVLSREKKEIGRLEVVSTDDTVSTMNLSSGSDTYQLGDHVKTEAVASGSSGGWSGSTAEGCSNGFSNLIPPAPEKDNSDTVVTDTDENKEKIKPTLALGFIKLNCAAKVSNGFGASHLVQITNLMINKLSKNRRFSLLDRQEVGQLLEEKNFHSRTSQESLQGKYRQLKAVDYMIYGEITNFYIKTKQTKVPYLDEIQVSAVSYAEGSLRIVNAHTGEIIGAENIVLKNEVKKGAANRVELMSKLIDSFSTEAVAKVSLRLFPIKVMGMSSSGIVYLNKGEDSGIRVGTRYQIYREGEVLVDPDTGETFGSMEEEIALIKIVSVEASRSKAKLITGARPESGDLAKYSTKPEKKKKVQRTMAPSW